MSARPIRFGALRDACLALRLHRRRRLRDLAAGATRPKPSRAGCSRERSRADRPRRARFAAPRGGPLPLWPRARRDDRSRSRRASPGRSRSGGASKADFPARRASRRRSPTARPAGASASGPTGRRRRATAPRSSTPPGAPIGRVTSGGFGPSVGAPIAMGYVASAAAAPGDAARPLSCAASRSPRASPPCPSIPTPITAADDSPAERGKSRCRKSASPRTTNTSASTATSARWASAITRSSSSATSSSSNCRRSARSSPRARARRWSKA